MTEITKNISRVQERIENSARKAGRDASEILLVAVTKTHPVEAVNEAVRAGLSHFGENRIQEASEKIPLVGTAVHWHLLGHLQRNKVKKALSLFEMIHSLDSLRLASELNDRAVQEGRTISCLAEVNTSGEDSKYGIGPEQAIEFCHELADFPGIDLQGLMTIGPFTGEPEDARPCFKMLRMLRDKIIDGGLTADGFKHLSMGMTSDFEIAVEEGATIVRIGSAIFGSRRYS
jgi:pyridoxal phosphate enzyme (YggS family)